MRRLPRCMPTVLRWPAGPSVPLSAARRRAGWSQRVCASLALLVLLACAGHAAGEPGASDVCTVSRIVDADTLVCDGGGRVRLLLIDAPELSQAPWGEAARAVMVSLAPVGTQLRMDRDVQPRDRYGRTLAYLWLEDGRLLNEELLRAGVAVVAVYPPNVRYVERFRAVQADARERGVGLWATSAFECAPGEYRAGRC